MWDKPSFWTNGVPHFYQRNCVTLANLKLHHHSYSVAALFLRVHSQAFDVTQWLIGFSLKKKSWCISYSCSSLWVAHSCHDVMFCSSYFRAGFVSCFLCHRGWFPDKVWRGSSCRTGKDTSQKGLAIICTAHKTNVHRFTLYIEHMV